MQKNDRADFFKKNAIKSLKLRFIFGSKQNNFEQLETIERF